MGQGVLHVVIRHGFQIVIFIIIVGIGPVSSRHQLLQVPVFIFARLFLLPRGLHRHQLSLFVVLHGLRYFLGQGQVVKIRHIPVPFISADHTDALHLSSSLLRYNGQRGILPFLHV